MKARLKDVAEMAGVAPNTASTILNRRPNSWASKATEERVFRAAEKLNYRPSRAALGLRLGSFRTVGVVIPDIFDPFYNTFADLLEQHMREADYDLIIESTRNDLEYEPHCLDSILERQIDAVVYFVGDLDRHLKFIKKAEKMGKKVVGLTADSGETPFPFDSVEIDFTPGLREAVTHLIQLGHRSFAFLSALAKGQKAGDRPILFDQLLREHGIPFEDRHFIDCAHDMESAKGSFGAFLDRIGDRSPTALIAINDLSAISAMRAARERKMRIPEDLSVIGINNIPIGNFLMCRLTSIAQPIDEMAKATAEILLQRLENKSEATADQPIARRFRGKLVVKESTSHPPSGSKSG